MESTLNNVVMNSTRLFFDVDQAIFLARDDADGRPATAASPYNNDCPVRLSSALFFHSEDEARQGRIYCEGQYHEHQAMASSKCNPDRPAQIVAALRELPAAREPPGHGYLPNHGMRNAESGSGCRVNRTG